MKIVVHVKPSHRLIDFSGVRMLLIALGYAVRLGRDGNIEAYDPEEPPEQAKSAVKPMEINRPHAGWSTRRARAI